MRRIFTGQLTRDLLDQIKAILVSNTAMLYASALVFLILVFAEFFGSAASGALFTDNSGITAPEAPFANDSYIEAFAASTSPKAGVFVIGIPLNSEDGGPSGGVSQKVQAVRTESLIRGTSVEPVMNIKKIDDTVYVQVRGIAPGGKISPLPGMTPDFAPLYMRAENIAWSPGDIVQEKEVYVRTPATLYSGSSGPEIASFAKKGRRLEVAGYDRLNKDGTVNKYKVRYEKKNGSTAEAYVYSKYVTDTEEKANAIYKGNGIYKKVKKDKYSFNLYGGKTEDLDYYPYEKTVIEGKEFCEDARAMYLTCVSAADPKRYIKLIKETDCNAVVADIKDGVLAWPAQTAKDLSPTSYKTAYTTKKAYKKGIDSLRKTGVYMIGRIVVFNDPIYAKDHPEDCIKYRGRTYWPSAYDRDVWEYNVKLAREAIEEFGFDEIQFDYVRFPESSYEMSKSKKTRFRNKYGEEKGQAIQNFCFYAADQIHEAGAYFSVDVFGESAYGYMTAYGQYWPGISNIVDAISAMPYTDHMGGENTWKNPYGTVKAWAKKAKKMQDYLEHPAAARTWITGYDTPYWDPTVNYGKKQLKAQVRALKDAGLTGGFIPWNAGNSLAKYNQYKAVWNK